MDVEGSNPFSRSTNTARRESSLGGVALSGALRGFARSCRHTQDAVEGVLGLASEACATSWAAWHDIAAPISTLHDLGQPVSNPFSRSEELMIKKKRISWSELSKFPGRITPIT